MKRLFILLLGISLYGYAQEVPSPEDFLGYPLGTQFTRYHQIQGYCKEVARLSPRVEYRSYGKTYEGRELGILLISQEENLARKEEIRLNNLRAVGFEDGEIQGKRIPSVWLSYNIHGNEASPSEAAMKTLYQLATADTADWLKDVFVIMDPCINPDGRERFVNWFRQVANQRPNVHRESWEHVEPWPGGRVNHYLFDLNRDWCWQTQVESRQRALIYHQWMPQVHVDYHEQDIEAPYYFGPAAEPYHEVITDWQREYQALTGKNHARYFDKNGWLYFTREIFDLFYPSYGDTWPIFQGAIGFTYEQAGHGNSGRAVLQQNGDTLRLLDRLTHHFVTGLSTIEVAVDQKEALLSNFDQYFARSRKSPEGPYQSFVISHENPPNKLNAFRIIMDRNKIQYYHPGSGGKKYLAYDYQAHGKNSFELDKDDIVIPLRQAQAHLVRVLLEPNARLVDSLTYDLTAWSLPFAFDLKAYALKEAIPKGREFELIPPPVPPSPKEAYGYVVKWEDFGSAQFLSQALQSGFGVRSTTASTVVNGEKIDTGSLLFLQADNKGKDLRDLYSFLNPFQEIQPIYTGYSDTGKDLGSEDFRLIRAPRIALVGGRGTRPGAFGECWHYLERGLDYPLSVIPAERLGRAPLDEYDVLILPSGSYEEYRSDIHNFVRQGGRVIALERAMQVFDQYTEEESFRSRLAISIVEAQKEGENGSPTALRPYGGRDRQQISSYTPGSIYALQLDPSHPLAYGLGDQLHIIKRSNKVYPYIEGGYQVGIIEDGAPVSGFAGQRLQQALANSLVWGAEEQGNGKIIYFTDSPIFRGFWYGGKLALANSIFLWN